MRLTRIFLLVIFSILSSLTTAQTVKKSKPVTVEPARAVLLFDRKSNTIRQNINAYQAMPIASITKVMTAYVVLDSGVSLDEMLTVVPQKLETSRTLKAGTQVSRLELVRLSLVVSDNLAAKLLAVHHPGGHDLFVEKMNQTARSLGMVNTNFIETTGLLQNTSTAWDLHLLNKAATKYSIFREAAMSKTLESESLNKRGIWQRVIVHNTSAFAGDYDIKVSKTGFTAPAGWCIAMMIEHQGHTFDLIVLGSPSKKIRNDLVSSYLKDYMNFITRNSVIQKIDLTDNDTGFESPQ
jgi:D-alanyl-D-alanine endopeptidase (penicillin-binding protein 7)